MIDIAYSTDLLRRLRWKHILGSRLEWLRLPSEPTYKWLVELDRVDNAAPPPEVSRSVLEKLRRWGLIATGTSSNLTPKPLPLPFVTAINFELTYDCDLRCQHCLQQNIRSRLSGTWLNSEASKRTITEAWFAGLVTTGINFTGGEIFDRRSNLPELLETAKSLNIPFRINTNGWWGDKKSIALGERVFANPRQLIKWLQKMGMAILALSYDERYEQYPQLWPPLLSLIRECERLGQDYQLVVTGNNQGMVDEIWKRIAQEVNIVPRRMVVVPMEMVDLGGAVKNTVTPLRAMQLAIIQYDSPCQGLGFTRPSLLHIGPHGGIRTCMYAPGASTLGNIISESLLDIINRFNSNPVVRFFQQDDFGPFVNKYISPFSDLYRNTEHPCAISAILVRTVEEVERFKLQTGTELSPEDLRRIHSFLAQDFNLQTKKGVSVDVTHHTFG